MAKIKILLVSVLKPVNDTRMYEKIGLALAKIDNAEIHIAGFKANNFISSDKIESYPLFNFKRLSIKRLFASYKIWRIILKVKPEVLICSTHELLVVTVLYKILFGCKVIYDVQENYYRNLWYGKQFPFLIRHVIAVYVRFKERILSPFVDSYLLAEKSYQVEMPFMTGKSLLFENKFRKPLDFTSPVLRKRTPLKLLYTGTIAELYGIYEVIKLAEQLLDLSEGTLTIIGFCPDKQVLNRVNDLIASDKRMVLIGGEEPVSHESILLKINECNLGLLGYKDNPAISSRIPTKLYEYLACHLPFIYPETADWGKWASKYNAGISINYSSYDRELILDTFRNKDFYSIPPDDSILIDSEEAELRQLITNFFV